MKRDTEEQVNIICSAIQHVFHANDIPLKQMKVAGRKRSLEEHSVAIGDKVITVGSTLVDYSDWRRAVGLEEQISAKVAELLNIRGLSSDKILVHLSVHNNLILAEVSKPYPDMVVWKDVAREADDLIIVGRDVRKNPVFLDLEKVSPGILVVGASGMGKTNAMRLITAQAVKLGIETYLACLKGRRDWNDLIPIVDGTAFNNFDGSKLLTTIQQRVNLRNEEKESIDNPILLVWDEASEPVTNEVNQIKIGTLAKTCRSSNVILLVGTQTADNELNKSVRANLKNRYAFKVVNSNISYMNTGRPALGAEKLLPYEMLSIIDGHPDRISVPRAEERDLEGLVKSIMAGNEVDTDKTLGELLNDFAEEELEKDRRRNPPINEALLACIYYWRYGSKPTLYTLESIYKSVTGKRIRSNKGERALEFLDKYIHYVETRNDEYRRQLGGAFNSQAAIGDGELYHTKWESIRVGE